MAPDQIQAFYSLANAARGLSNAVAAAADILHGGEGIPPAMRAVLETVIVTGPRTVPAIARARAVSRQHIQALVDRLQAAALVEYRDNPAHRRSRLVAATDFAKAAIAALRAREWAALSRLDVVAGATAMKEARETLAALIAALEGRRWRAIAHELSSGEAGGDGP